MQNKKQKRIPSKTIQQRIKEQKWIEGVTVGVSVHGRGGEGSDHICNDVCPRRRGLRGREPPLTKYPNLKP